MTTPCRTDAFVSRVSVKEDSCALPAEPPVGLVFDAAGKIVREYEIVSDCCVAPTFGAHALVVVAVPKHATALAAKAPIRLVRRILSYARVRQQKVVASRFMGGARRAKPTPGGISVPEELRALAAEAPASLMLRVIAEVMRQYVVIAIGLMATASRTDARVGAA